MIDIDIYSGQLELRRHTRKYIFKYTYTHKYIYIHTQTNIGTGTSHPHTSRSGTQNSANTPSGPSHQSTPHHSKPQSAAQE